MFRDSFGEVALVRLQILCHLERLLHCLHHVMLLSSSRSPLSFFPNFFSSTSHFTIFIIFPTRRYVLCKLRYLCVTFWIIVVFEYKEIYVDIFLRSNRVNAYRNPPRRLWPLWSSLKMTWDLWRLCSDGPEMDRDLYWTLWTLARSRLWPRDAGRPELHKCSGYGRLEEGRMGRRSLVPISTAACTLK